MMNRRTSLHMYIRGTGKANHYRNADLQRIIRLFWGTVGPKYILMNYNARPHGVALVDEFLENKYLNRTPWSAYSPDLNPIEHISATAG